MSNHHKHSNPREPLIIHLSDEEEDQHEIYDDDEVEVIRPHAPKAGNNATRERGLHSQPMEEDGEELPPSKTKIKKQMHELRDFGAELVNLSKDQLAQLDLPDNLRDAIRDMKNINKFGAQRRQIQYIGKLMREIDIAPIVAKLNVWNGTSQTHIAYMHQLERWRDRLMENDRALTELLAAHPEADAQRLRTLIRNAQKEIEASKPPKNFREIFQYLKEIIPEPI